MALMGPNGAGQCPEPPFAGGPLRQKNGRHLGPMGPSGPVYSAEYRWAFVDIKQKHKKQNHLKKKHFF